MEPLTSTARAAALQALAGFIHPPVHGGSTAALLFEAKGSFVTGLEGLLCACIDLNVLQASVSAAFAAFTAARQEALARAEEAALHNFNGGGGNGEWGEDGAPQLLLPLPDDLLTLFVNELHSDRRALCEHNASQVSIH